MNSFREYLVYLIVRVFGILIRCLPRKSSLRIGRMMGTTAYYCDMKRKSIVYANLKLAFAGTKTPDELKNIAKALFKNYGQNLIELLRLPLIHSSNYEQYVKIEGKEHINEALQQKKGVILLAMHFGSWELASAAFGLLGHTYKVFVKQQKKFIKLNELLNAHRAAGGSVVLSRGAGTRDVIKGLQNNEIIGMVVDQGGREGVLVPFFNRRASMSVGAIRMGLKFGVPLCFSVIVREKDLSHRLILHPPLKLEQTGNLEQDIMTNLRKITHIMEDYIRQYPAEYMWFYKIWKYSNESTTVILTDDKTGHLRQSQAVAKMISTALAERGIQSNMKIQEVKFKSQLAEEWISILSLIMNPFIFQGRLGFMKWFLTAESFKRIMSTKANFIVSCGSSLASVNYLLSQDQQAKSIAVLKPGLLSLKRFDLVVLPQHDLPFSRNSYPNVVISQGAPNLIDGQYLTEQTNLLLKRFSHLRSLSLPHKFTIGLLLGGDTKHLALTEKQVKLVLNQMKEVVSQMKDTYIMITTSRRTSPRIENMLMREMKKHPRCELLILANRNNVPEAVGGILGLCDTVIVSGDSISMISEAASSGKNIIVFPVLTRAKVIKGVNKHKLFIDQLNTQGYVLSANAKNIGQVIFNIAKNKMHTRRLDDNKIILEAARQII